MPPDDQADHAAIHRLLERVSLWLTDHGATIAAYVVPAAAACDKTVV